MNRLALMLVTLISVALTPVAAEDPDVLLFLGAASPDEAEAQQALETLSRSWRDGHAALLVDIARVLPPAAPPRGRDRSVGPSLGPSDGSGGAAGIGEDDPLARSSAGGPADSPGAAPGSPIRARLTAFLEQQTGQKFGDDLDAWRRWLWSRPYEPHDDYAYFKGGVYGTIDPRMREFFPRGVAARVRLDQIDWGGVKVDGIPPLVQPATVPAEQATWLKDKHVVFGVEIDGQARAYPKRILAWHEMALDRLGEIELTLVYCTLCGTVIPYDSQVGERRFTFGTSGLLYRSNKLMYDHETRSLWNTVYGEPVVGELADSGMRLRRLPVVTTTWGEWKAMHPDTTVLSLETGFQRDYGEGVAYRDYFRHDRTMFAVPADDDRLKNKDEVLVLSRDGKALALSVKFLRKHPVYMTEFAGRPLVIVTSPRGASRVYDRGGVRFSARDGDHVLDSDGRRWQITESALVPAGEGESRPRVAAHRSFWFGWVAMHPDTELVR